MTEAVNIVTLYREYRDFTLWGALSGNYDFETDYQAYRALVTGNVPLLCKAMETRSASVGKPNFKNTKTGSPRRQAREKLDAAMLAKAAR